MKPEQFKVLQELRHEGYAVITWTPEEVGDANPRKVEDCSIEQGWEIISGLGGPEPK